VDGQNLSTFEASLVNTRNAEVILSDMCGAAEILAPVCRTVNPFDLIDQAGGHRGRSHRACPAARSGRPAAPGGGSAVDGGNLGAYSAGWTGRRPPRAR
jgi:hypothetical protein